MLESYQTGKTCKSIVVYIATSDFSKRVAVNSIRQYNFPRIIVLVIELSEKWELSPALRKVLKI